MAGRKGNAKQDENKRPTPPNSPDDTASIIRLAMAAEMASMREIVADQIRDSLEKALDPIEKRLTENGNLLKSLGEQLDVHAKKFDTVSKRMDSIQDNVSNNENNIGSCLAEIVTLQKRLNMAEDRSRLYNVRLVNLPSGAEDDDPRGFLQKMLPKWIPSLDAVEVDKAHRIFSNNTSRPRTMIFKLMRFSDRQAILEGARKAKPSLASGTQLLFFADYSAGTTRERQEYKEIRATLRQKGIESFLVYPAVLKVNYKGKKLSFDSASEAKGALEALWNDG